MSADEGATSPGSLERDEGATSDPSRATSGLRPQRTARTSHWGAADVARVAAIDIGTNSVLLLIAEQQGEAIVPLIERATITRLGQGVDKTRALAPEAIDRTLACLQTYADEIRAFAPAKVVVVGTSAMRDAEGGATFRERARDILSVMPAVVSGDEEAELTFVGSLAGLETKGETLVFDVGGGSTEIIVGTLAGGPKAKISLDIGSVRLTERHIRSDPPTADEVLRVREDVRAALRTASFLSRRSDESVRSDASVRATSASPQCSARADESVRATSAAPQCDVRSDELARSDKNVGGPEALPIPAHFVGVAGTVTTLAAFVRNVVPYDGGRVHGATLSTEEIAKAAAFLASISLAERKALAAIEPKRADVIVCGAILVEELLAFCGAREVTVSDRGVRWGLAVRALSQ